MLSHLYINLIASDYEVDLEDMVHNENSNRIWRSSLLAAGTASAETMKVAADVGYSPHVMASASGGVKVTTSISWMKWLSGWG